MYYWNGIWQLQWYWYTWSFSQKPDQCGLPLFGQGDLYSADGTMENAPISYDAWSQYCTAYHLIRSANTKGRYLPKSSWGDFSSVWQIITKIDTSHQWSDEQMQHDCNADIFRGSCHTRVYRYSNILFWDISTGYEHYSWQPDSWNPCILASPLQKIPSKWSDFRYT